MPFTVEEFRDLVRLLEERPEWRADLRRLVLTDELLAVPEKIGSLRVRAEELRAEVELQRTETERRLQELTSAVADLAKTQKRLISDVGDLKGDAL